MFYLFFYRFILYTWCVITNTNTIYFQQFSVRKYIVYIYIPVAYILFFIFIQSINDIFFLVILENSLYTFLLQFSIFINKAKKMKKWKKLVICQYLNLFWLTETVEAIKYFFLQNCSSSNNYLRIGDWNTIQINFCKSFSFETKKFFHLNVKV